VSFSLHKQIIFFLILLSVLTACSSSVSGGTPTIGSTAILLPYQTSTPTQTENSNPSIELNLATPTPATYLVAEGDTFFSIAARLGISLDALMAANPDVDPRLLTPGTTLILPVAGGTEVASIPTPTPVALTVGETKCYSSALGELWCFLPIENVLPTSVENIIAVVQLLAPDGNVLTTLEATPPLNLLGTGAAMPLVAYTSNPPAGWTATRGQLLSAYSLSSESDYYLLATVQDASIDISADGSRATATGRVEIQNGEVGTIWVLAIAYDSAGDVVGIRRWESDSETEFQTIVYSLGSKIADVDLLVEARP
jgi:LysM repeat protein